MPFHDINDFVDVLLSWRLYLGLAITAGLCWLFWRFIPHEPLAIGLCIPTAITGLVLSWRWQCLAESRN